MGNQHGGVAQLGEHLPCKQGVMGSNPIISITQVKRKTDRLDRTSTEAKQGSTQRIQKAEGEATLVKPRQAKSGGPGDNSPTKLKYVRVRLRHCRRGLIAQLVRARA